MRKTNNSYQLSPTDLANFLGCRHATSLDMRRANGDLEIPFRSNARLDRLAEKGLRHEHAYLQSLKDRGLRVESLSEFDDTRQAEITEELMREGVDVIFQAALSCGPFAGRADFLIRVDAESKLGDWSYEVVDTKLSQDTKAGTILQLCCYSDCVAAIQGGRSMFAYVVKPASTDQREAFEKELFRLDGYWAYFELIKRQLIESTGGDCLHNLYPEPVAHCEVCRWFPHCDDRRRNDDHLSFIAGIQTSQASEVRRQGLPTLTAFAEADAESIQRPAVGSKESLLKVHHQARIQQRGRTSGENIVEHLPIVWPDETLEKQPPPMGFLRLPEPDPGDIYLDFEGDPHAPDGVLEYLFGYVDRDEIYSMDWSLHRQSEREAFNRLMRDLIDQQNSHPNFHVYHFAPYEPAAIKRMASRHQLHEDALDDFLRREMFVDLHAVVRQSMVLSVESYSIKKLEAFYSYKRRADLADVRPALSEVEWAIEMGGIDQIEPQTLDLVAAYNRDDCVSTLKLHQWLEEQRALVSLDHGPLPRPTQSSDDRKPETIERQAAFIDVREQLKLLAGDVRDTETQQARWLAGHLLEYFFREDKTVWWEYFRHRDLEDEELLFENAAVAGLELVEQISPQGRDRNPTSVYRYPAQEHKVRVGHCLKHRDGLTVGTVVDINPQSRSISIKKTGKSSDFHPTSVFVHDLVAPGTQPDSLLEFAREVASSSWPNENQRCARTDLLCGRPPRLLTLSLPLNGESVSVATAVALDLDQSVLPIQGPPGTGKTYHAARMIVALASQGKKVGVTAVSHKVIANLLNEAAKFDQEGKCTFAHKPKKGEKDTVDRITVLNSNPDALDAVSAGTVVGATAWLWSSEPAEGILDYLFVDEAGQMSLAVALSAMRAAKNVILLGDPQQLEQPQRAAHPEGADIAALAHLIQDGSTIKDSQGIFLADTYRLHPDVCDFTSEQFYEGRLKSEPKCQNICILGNGPLSGTGLRLVSVDHVGNQNRSDEEVAVVSAIVQHLLTSSTRWRDKENDINELEPKDILIVAPYNAQVDALSAAIGDRARIGTVDKFQGQEAPVLIYSTASSSADDAPRGMEFLYDPNRLNVATSRSKCMTIMVAAPKLFEPACRTPRQMQLANTFCRYAELAVQVDHFTQS
ncbi:RecBCD enzyme subunit RecD [Planctomycetes bacterium CA13]|uniref:RecBCD enzyme subunit RecD n=1 Tax=Novipirellula herctigrandis TaxID=2527986 RepID=A0A5C5ZBM5_9BACT|nr:RecBCD enzyme subunit RecD [Planctomycetes bacterium CA13]